MTIERNQRVKYFDYHQSINPDPTLTIERVLEGKT